jgi:predicted alternative tryptophan synthase beta-subunit
MRWNLPSERVPEARFNVVPHLPEPLQPPLHPATRQPVGPDDLAPLFPMALIGQEVTAEPWGEEKVILFNYSGHGLVDLGAYDDFLHGRLVDA